jgi:hypothetical protein
VLGIVEHKQIVHGRVRLNAGRLSIMQRIQSGVRLRTPRGKQEKRR